MNSRIKPVRNCHRKYCNWGERRITYATEYVGGPVPLLRNPKTIEYGRLAILSGLLLFTNIIVIVVAIVYANRK